MLVEFTGNSTEKLDAFVIVVVVSLFSLLSLEITAAPVGTDDILSDDEVDDFVIVVADNFIIDSIDDAIDGVVDEIVDDFVDKVIVDFVDEIDIVEDADVVDDGYLPKWRIIFSKF